MVPIHLTMDSMATLHRNTHRQGDALPRGGARGEENIVWILVALFPFVLHAIELDGLLFFELGQGLYQLFVGLGPDVLQGRSY